MQESGKVGTIIHKDKIIAKIIDGAAIIRRKVNESEEKQRAVVEVLFHG